ncbi:MAG: hypothetical protein ACRDSZ_17405 [Pseudonocardiaceae bacterium]
MSTVELSTPLPAPAPTDRDDGACPRCGTTSGVQLTSTSPVQSRTCTAYFDRLAAAVEQLGAARSVLRAVIALADELPKLTDVELRDRLLALADRRRKEPAPPGHAGRCPEIPAGAEAELNPPVQLSCDPAGFSTELKPEGSAT